MKWKTHIRITNEVLRRLGIILNREEYNALKEGVLTPDKRKDFPPHQYPHHYGKTEVIKDFIKSARASFLQDDLLTAYNHLGIVLHYVQDSYTTYPSFLEKHEEWEEWIENSYYVSNLEDAIQNTVRDSSNRRRYSLLAKQLEVDVQDRDDTIRIATLNMGKKDQQSIASPEVDFNLGFRASYAVAKSILGAKSHPPLNNQLAQTLARYEEKMVTSEAKSSDDLIQLIRERDDLIKRVPASKGLIGRIKNWIARRKADKAVENAIAAKTDYFQRNHLQKVVSQYMLETHRLTNGYSEWFVFQISQLDPNGVPTALVDIKEASQNLNLSTTQVEVAMKDQDLPLYWVDGTWLMKRTDLGMLSGLEACSAK